MPKRSAMTSSSVMKTRFKDTRKPKRCSLRRETPLEPSKLFKLEKEVFLKICEDINTPRSLACWMLFYYEEYNQYLELPFPDSGNDQFPDDYLVTEAMRKNPRLKTGIDTKTVAIDGFLASEQQCKATNLRIESYLRGEISLPPEMEDILTKQISYISKILSEGSTVSCAVTDNDLEYWFESCRFGPGSTSAISGWDVLPSRKYIAEMQCTPRLVPFWKALGWGPTPVITGCSKVTTVPKSAKTDRTIAIEPHCNIFAQLGVGALIRKKLQRFGLPCDKGQLRSKYLASQANRLNLATIDLSSASDTIAFKVVEFLLPPDWFHLLMISRVDATEVDGKRVSLEKFSSMGNGFTWELETLIFYTLALACSDEKEVTTAYGDDIIVPRNCIDKLQWMLDFLGFSMNRKKSFWQGDFFESCGSDFFRSNDVRPFYFKGEPSDVHSQAIRMANAIRRYAHRRGYNTYCDIRFYRAWYYLARYSPLAYKTAISEFHGDDGLIRNFDEATPSKARNGWEGFFSLTLKRGSIYSNRTIPTGALLHALHRGCADSVVSRETIRGKTKSPQYKYQLIVHWYNLGPWS